jgi:hypothetical protein
VTSKVVACTAGEMAELLQFEELLRSVTQTVLRIDEFLVEDCIDGCATRRRIKSAVEEFQIKKPRDSRLS